MTDLRDGIFHKLDRARELRAGVDDLITSYLTLTAQHALIEAEASEDLRMFKYFVKNVHAPPPRIAVMTGEVLQHARSSLDYLLWALVLRNGNQPTKDNQFPICSRRDAYDNQLRRHRLDGISPGAMARIEGLQPFHQQDPQKATLQVLQNLNAWDKHSELPVLATAAAVHPDIVLSSGIIETLGDPRGVLVKDGVAQVFEIGLSEPDPGFSASLGANLSLSITLPGASEPLPLREVLRKSLDRVAQIVDEFDAEFA